MHGDVFRACAVLTQLAINDGDKLFSCGYNDRYTIVEEKSGEVHLVVRTTMEKLMMCNVIITTSVVSLGAGGSSGFGESVTMNTGISSDCGVGLLRLTSGL